MNLTVCKDNQLLYQADKWLVVKEELKEDKYLRYISIINKYSSKLEHKVWENKDSQNITNRLKYVPLNKRMEATHRAIGMVLKIR